MKVYFNASPRYKRDHVDEIKKIGQIISQLGHTLVSDFILNVNVEEFYSLKDEDVSNYYKKTTNDLKKSDVVVLETSIHSLAIGYLANLALEQGKPLVALYSKGNEPFFFNGVDDDKLQLLEYSGDNINEVLTNGLSYATEQQDTRFNFFISPKIGAYLDWISRNKRIPRAVYLRNLIKTDMEKSRSVREEK